MRKKYSRGIIFFVLIILAIATKSLSVVFPLVMQRAIDAGIAHKLNEVSTFVILLCIIGFTNGVVDMIDQVMEKKYANLIAHTYRKKISNHIMNLEPNEFQKHEKSEYVSVINNNINIVVNNYYIFILNVIKCVMVIIFTIGALLSLNAVLSVIIIITASLTVINPFLFRKKLDEQNNVINSSLKKINSKLDDFLEGYLTGRIFSAKEKLSNRFVEASDELSKENVRYWKYMQAPNAVSVLFTYTRDISLVGVGVYLMYKGQITAGTLFAAVQLSNLLSAPAVNLSYLISSIVSTKGMKQELDKMTIVTGKNEMDSTNYVKRNIEPVDIKIRDLSFNYEEKNILNNINLHIEAGKKYLLVGESGSGKSSLIRILSKLLAEYSGSVTVKSRELRNIEPKEWYSNTAVIQQNSVLFHDTLYNNMTLWDTLSSTKLEENIEKLNLTKLIEDSGIDSDFINGECVFSGGEQQRIAFVRCLLEERGLLLIDEATSALDYANYMRVETLLLNSGESTVINITHKIHPEIAKQYDEIIFMKEGAIVAVGKYDHLTNKNKEFQNFLSLS